jgi:hypothetical protein
MTERDRERERERGRERMTERERETERERKRERELERKIIREREKERYLTGNYPGISPGDKLWKLASTKYLPYSSTPGCQISSDSRGFKAYQILPIKTYLRVFEFQICCPPSDTFPLVTGLTLCCKQITLKNNILKKIIFVLV